MDGWICTKATLWWIYWIDVPQSSFNLRICESHWVFRTKHSCCFFPSGYLCRNHPWCLDVIDTISFRTGPETHISFLALRGSMHELLQPAMIRNRCQQLRVCNAAKSAQDHVTRASSRRKAQKEPLKEKKFTTACRCDLGPWTLLWVGLHSMTVRQAPVSCNGFIISTKHQLLDRHLWAVMVS